MCVCVNNIVCVRVCVCACVCVYIYIIINTHTQEHKLAIASMQQADSALALALEENTALRSAAILELKSPSSQVTVLVNAEQVSTTGNGILGCHNVHP